MMLSLPFTLLGLWTHSQACSFSLVLLRPPPPPLIHRKSMEQDAATSPINTLSAVEQ